MKKRSHTELPEGLRLERMISVAEAAQLRGVSADTFRRHHAHLIRRLSPRRRGVRLRDVLADDSAA